MILEADEKMKIGGKEYKVRFTVKSISIWKRNWAKACLPSGLRQ
nr:MAG TPA_asm: tail assembly chaperone protein [Caudoviricetes sp.]